MDASRETHETQRVGSGADAGGRRSPVEVPAAAAPEGPVGDRIRAVGAELGTTLRAVLAAVPGRPGRPAELARALNLNRDISSRVLGAMSKQNPLEIVHMVPGPEPIRRLLRAAEGQGVDSKVIDAATSAVHRFDALIRDEAGTRSGLNAIISALLPNAQQRFELASRQSVFKGMSQLKGIQADVWLSTALVYPSADDPMKHDVALIHGAVGMQRLKPDARVKFTYSELQPDPVEQGGDATEVDGAVRLDQFCLNAPAQLDAWRVGTDVSYTLRGNDVGPKCMMDMLVVDHHRAVLDRYRSPDAPRSKKGTFVAPDIPVKLLVFDVILHEDVWPGSDPELAVYDMGPEGTAWVNNPARDIDRMPVSESVEFLGRGFDRFHTDAIGTYVDMLRFVAARFGQDPQRFRGHRCLMQYPVHGWQVCLSFDPPEAPSTPSADG